MIPALVLAGSPNTGPLRDVSPAPSEALIDVHGRPLTAYVIEALLATPVVGRVVVVGPRDLGKSFGSDRIVILPLQGGLLENLAVGLKALANASRVLVVTGDLALLTPSAVAEFLQLCSSEEADVFYPVVPRDAVEKAYPTIKRTYVRLREGVFTGGNVGLVDPAVLIRSLDRARDFVRLRKKPLRLALVVGPGVLGRFLLGRLSLREAEKKVSRILGLRGRAVIASIPEIGVDVDKPGDLEVVKDVLKER
ncbi:MAG: NTP transferase domain-containing protein [Bacillota bacterium]